MIALAGEIGNGMVFANAARSHVHESLDVLSASTKKDVNFFIGSEDSLQLASRRRREETELNAVFWRRSRQNTALSSVFGGEAAK